MIQYQCRKCGTEMRAPANEAGHVSWCPECGKAITVPRPGDPNTKPMTPARAWRIVARVLVAAGILLMVFGVMVAASSSRIQSDYYMAAKPASGWYGSNRGHTRVSGSSTISLPSVYGGIIVLVGTVGFCTGLSILHRESFRQRRHQ